MKKKLLTLIPIMMLLAACNPNFSDDSSFSPDSGGTSSEQSATSSSETSEDSEEESESIEPPEPPAEKTLEELCDEMNEKLISYDVDYVNAYSARNYLVANGYDYIASALEDDQFFGFDNAKKKVALYKMANNECVAVYPTDCVGHNVTSYQSVNASSFLEMNNALTNIESGKGNYSVIKLANNLNIDSASNRIVINSSYPVELDLNKKAINASINVDLISVTGSDSIFSIRNGTLSTVEHEDYDLDVSPRCVYVGGGDMVLIDSMTLNARAFCGYGYINEIGITDTKTVISNSIVNAITVAICVQDGINYIEGNTIDGIVDINGGKTIVDRCDITAVGHKDEAEGIVTNIYVAGYAKDLLETHSDIYDTYIISSVDPIFILDRRSIMGTYSSPDVRVSNCKLTADYEGDVVYGYGVRYIDLKLGNPAQQPGTIDLGNSLNNYNGNTYAKCKDSNPEEALGGFSKYTAS